MISQRKDRPPSLDDRRIVPVSRTATVLVADAVGYTHAMSLDELGTLTALDESRSIVRRAVSIFGGRIFSMKGDSIFVEYGSTLSALNSAMSIQCALARAKSSGYDVLQFRMGLHAGKVYPDQGNLLGDTINVAARLERLAPPGGLCISGLIRDRVRAPVDLAMDDRGFTTLRGIKEPVRITVCRLRP